MLISILKRLYERLVLLAAVLLVVLAAYVSAGRQFMPAVASHGPFLERQIFRLTGLPVRIDSLTGSFQGFNPGIRIDGLSVQGPEGERGVGPLLIDHATLVLDVPRSLWQRRLVLQEVLVESMQVEVQQGEDGSWRLRGASGNPMELEDLFQMLRGIARASVNEVVVLGETARAEPFALHGGTVIIQNRGRSHYLHVNTTFEPGSPEIVLSSELEGNTLDTLDGLVHVHLPRSDYSSLLGGETLVDFRLEELIGGGDLWFELEQGGLARLVSRPHIDRLVLAHPQGDSIVLEDLGGGISLSEHRESGRRELVLADMGLRRADHEWRPFNLHAAWDEPNGVSLRADRVDLELVSQLLLSSGVLSGEAEQQLRQYAPEGMLENIDFGMTPLAGPTRDWKITANIAGGAVRAVGGVPEMAGINGYAEAAFDANDGLRGLVEVESSDFSINIPTVFTRFWEYSRVNGRVDFRFNANEGSEVMLVSSPIVAESPGLEGRARFTLMIRRQVDGSLDSELELAVGARHVDVRQKSLYLPDGPRIHDNLRRTMTWLDGAILGGELHDSAVLFRGPIHQGADRIARTFQGLFRLDEGEFRFSEEWPALGGLTGSVSTDDVNVDIQVSRGNSLGLAMSQAGGTLRPVSGGGSLVEVSGAISGATDAALGYLQRAPLDPGLQQTLADWRSEGELAGDIRVQVPLGISGSEVAVNLDLEVDDNFLSIPDWNLDFQRVNGRLLFDTGSGLEGSAFQARLFDRPVDLWLGSPASSAGMEATTVDAVGSVATGTLLEWLPATAITDSLATRIQGEIDYGVRLTLPGNGDAGVLSVDSDLRGGVLNLPWPLGKDSRTALPLHLDVELGASQTLDGRLGSELAFTLELRDGALQDGLVRIGRNAPAPVERPGDDARGLTVVGEMPRLPVEEWTGFLSELSTDDNVGAGNVALVDLRLDVLELYGQELPNVAVRIEPDPINQGWLNQLDGDTVRGRVLVPWRRGDYLQVDLDHLRLPGEEEEALAGAPEPITATAEYTSTEEDPGQDAPPMVTAEDIAARLEELIVNGEAPGMPLPEAERVDMLAAVDPRQLPPMKFATDEFMIGSRPWGSWRFTLDPGPGGAAISDLAFDFRGLRLGQEQDAAADADDPELLARYTPRFDWLYDGENHSSELRGILRADDMAEVLTANGFAPSFESDSAVFYTNIRWPGSPAFFAAAHLSGAVDLEIEDGRFLQDSGGPGALKLISILNLNAIMRRLRFSDDMLRRGLAYDEINANLRLQDGLVAIQDRLVISGPSSMYQITGEVDLEQETIHGEMYVTLPVSDNLPWVGLATGNLPLAAGVYLLDLILGRPVDALTSAVYTLDGPWEGLQPEFKQVFGSPESPREESPEPQAPAEPPMP